MWCTPGSILGSLLFILYINDIVKISKVLELILFAFDTNIFMSDNKLDILNDKVNFEPCKISTWFKINKLSLNVNKTNIMLFTCKKSNSLKQPFNVKIDEMIVQ